MESDDPSQGRSTALIPYQRMDRWERLLQAHGERRESALSSSALSCEKARWAFKVKLVNEDDPLWPDDSFTFRVDMSSGADEIHVVPARASGVFHLDVKGEGPNQGQTACEVRDWVVTAQPAVTLPDDDGRTFEVKIHATRWIKLRVRRHDEDTVVPGVTLKLSVPEAVEVKPVTAHDTLHVDHGFTRLGKVAVQEMRIEQGVWEYVP